MGAYGSSGPGNPLHLTMEMIKHAAGVDIVAVPFRGTVNSCERSACAGTSPVIVCVNG